MRNAWWVRAVYLWIIVCGLESMMLVWQHEGLQAGREGWTSPEHEYMKPRSMHPPAAPDPTLLAQLRVKVGISKTYPLEKAVDEVTCGNPPDTMNSQIYIHLCMHSAPQIEWALGQHVLLVPVSYS